MIPYGRQDVQQDDIEAVVAVLKSDFLTQGPVVPRFEDTISGYCGAKHSVALNSATSALHVSLLALDVGPGDCVWTSPNTFVASANAALYCGANVDFVDIDPYTYNMCAVALEKKLRFAKLKNCLPKVVIPVHFAGQSCDMKSIHKLSLEYDFRIVEDASHAIGGTFCKMPIGNCAFSDITVFSFHPVKIITTAEGGMALTNNDRLFNRLKLFRSHGITRDPKSMTGRPDGPWYYQQIELGYNYRMTDLQAALGLSQSNRLNYYIERRHQIARKYNSKLGALPIKLPLQTEDSYSAYHLYVIRLNQNTNVPHKALFENLRAKNIMVNLHYIPVHLQPYYQKLGFKIGDYPEAESYYKQAISLPIFPNLTDQQQDTVIRTLHEILKK